LAERPEDASVLVLNTWHGAPTTRAARYGRIAHWKAVRRPIANPSVKVIVTGLSGEQDKDRMRAIVPHVDGVFGHARARRASGGRARGLARANIRTTT